ncbi:SDR family oxidoreductase [Ramlibacter henchirensis]|uniref:SDR family oxidoreductase n=1 Tax=Ramlibacter henchirensis TaxID=204072 RepID=A0A4Z0BUC9_9BURK|nr:SDR family oxidoreductase [Ramlibacter henchirensis]TFZ02906.1 SDR family oxidoreductase [Ramlibacter henchirensis]
MSIQEQLFSLSGKTAFISGASSGIGQHTARTLARAGARVVLAARREDKLAHAVEGMRGEGLAAWPVALDVTQPASILQAWGKAEQLLGSPIDVLFNCAGIIYVERFLLQDAEEVQRVFDTNLKGAFLLAQEAAKHMAQRGSGSIINVASTSGLRAAGRLASYGASKAGLLHLTSIMALELASKGVRVNALAPGNIETDMHDQFEDAGLAEHIRQRIPQRRFGDMGDLDGASLLLAADAGRYITGAVIPVDGGQLLTWM